MFGLAVLFIFFLVLYAYYNHSREFEATASAIREIWTGSCRLSCRPNRYCGETAVSCQNQVTESKPWQGELDQYKAGNSDCICETCPCALVENVIRTCSPATSLYSQCIDMVSRGYCYALKALSDAYNDATLPVCGVPSCMREAQLLSIRQFGSTDNISFVNKTAVSAEQTKKGIQFRATEEETARQERELSPGQGKQQLETIVTTEEVQELLQLYQRKEGVSIKNEEPESAQTAKQSVSQKKATVLGQTTKGVSQIKELDLSHRTDAAVLKSDKTSKANQSVATEYDSDSTSLEETESKKSCSKCIEEGKICIGTCPKANQKTRE